MLNQLALNKTLPKQMHKNINGIKGSEMAYNLQKNKKGFTLVELVVVIAILAIIVAFATPNYMKSVARRERLTAQDDAQHIYRLAISAITDLKWERLSPTAQSGMHDANYAQAIVKKLYDNSAVMDIGLMYYTGEGNTVKIPDGYSQDVRSKMVNGGNANPYMVVQVKNINDAYTLIVSYHNDANIFTTSTTNEFNVDTQKTYKTNDNKAIIYSYTIRF